MSERKRTCHDTNIIEMYATIAYELFLNDLKSSNDRTKLLDGKEAEFYDNFSDINDLKIRLLVTTQRFD